MGRRAAIVVTLLSALAGAGCSQSSTDLSLGEPVLFTDRLGQAPMEDPDSIISRASAFGVGPAPSGTITETHVERPYHLDTGDRLRVFVYGQPNLSRLYVVDQSGQISVPLIGEVRARGRTTAQLEGAIRAALGRSLVRDPQVTVDIQQNRPFFILGEVRSAGQYPYVTGMTAETAVAIAGGYGDRASWRKVRITRRHDGVTDVMDVTPDTEIEPGDTVFVYERFF